jgi:hypothetical protein
VTRLLYVIALVTACGGRPSAPAHHAAKPPGGGGSERLAVEPTESRSDERTNDECGKLVEHALALGDAERPPEQALTGDERARLAAELRERWAAPCKEMTSRGYQCALAARTLVELDACGGQARFKSSTSNSRVAFGGMTPPAPRAP